MLTVKKQNEKDKKQMKAKGGGEEEEKGAPCESGPGADLRPAFIHSSPDAGEGVKVIVVLETRTYHAKLTF